MLIQHQGLVVQVDRVVEVELLMVQQEDLEKVVQEINLQLVHHKDNQVVKATLLEAEAEAVELLLMDPHQEDLIVVVQVVVELLYQLQH